MHALFNNKIVQPAPILLVSRQVYIIKGREEDSAEVAHGSVVVYL